MRLLKFILRIFFLSLLFSASYSFNLTLIKYKGGDHYNARKGVANFITEVKKRTNIRIEDKFYELSLDDPEIFNHYFLILNGHVPVELDDVEKKNLKLFLENGGFLFANDDYGMDKSFRKLMAELFPLNPLVEIPFNHSIYHCFYSFKDGLPKIHEHEPGPPKAYGIFLKERLAVFYVYNADIMDGWDPPEVHNDPPQKREEAIKMGINILVYALLN